MNFMQAQGAPVAQGLAGLQQPQQPPTAREILVDKFADDLFESNFTEQQIQSIYEQIFKPNQTAATGAATDRTTDTREYTETH